MLVLDEGLSVIEAGRLCHRLQQAGFAKTSVLLGGVRSYVAKRLPALGVKLRHVSPLEIQEPLETQRIRLLLLEEFRYNKTGTIDHRQALAMLDKFKPASAPEQFMPVLVVGSQIDYELLSRKSPIPWWSVFLVGGEEAYNKHMSVHREVVANRHIPLRKCNAG